MSSAMPSPLCKRLLYALPGCLVLAVAAAAAQPVTVSCAVEPALTQGRPLALHAWAVNAAGRAADLPPGLRWQVDSGDTATGPVVAGQATAWTALEPARAGLLRAQLLRADGSALCTVAARRVGPIRGPRSSPIAAPRVHARHFLTRDRAEPGGYSALAFLLLPAPPLPAEKERCLRILSAWLRQLQPAAEMEAFIEREQITLFMLPQREAPALRLPGNAGDAAALRTAAQALLANYDHARAQALLATLGLSAAGPGPLLVTRQASPNGEPVLQMVEDFGQVDPVIAEAWLRWSLKLVAQPRAPSTEALQRVAMTLRNVIAHVARGLPDGGARATESIRVAALPAR